MTFAAWAGALLLLGSLHGAWLLSTTPWTLKAGVAGLLVLAVARPGPALLVWAGLAPLSTSLTEWAGSPLPGFWLLEAMTTAVIFGGVARMRGGPPTRLALPALLMAAVALASAVAELPARLLLEDFPADVLGLVRALFAHTFDRTLALRPWYFAGLVAGGAALAWLAETLVRRQPALAVRVLWCVVMGHAAVAVLNISRLVGASLQGGEFPASLPGLFLNVRLHSQYDVNAAGSILVLVLLLAIGLLARRRRLPVALAATAIGIALWLTGSRVAMAAMLAVLAGVLLLASLGSRRRLMIVGGAMVAAVALVAWLAPAYPTGRNLNIPASIETRLILFRAALGMARDAPVFGVGAGTFLEESAAYGATALESMLSQKPTHENAHDYFLQTLAEQGLLGLAALVLMLTAALWPAIRGPGRRDPITTWLAAGIIASVLTWATGHPLLLTEAALMFWLCVGILAGVTAPPPTGRVASVAPMLAAGVVAGLLVSVPFRARAAQAAAELDHLGTGVSLWQPEVDGVRYREAGTTFSLFLPSGTRLTLPLRSATSAALTVELWNATRLIDAAIVTADLWHPLRIQVPESASRYLRIDFRVVGDDAAPAVCDPCIRVGKIARMP